MAKIININPFNDRQTYIGYQYDHNANKVVFELEEEGDYYLKLETGCTTYQAIPIPNKEFPITSTYTQHQCTYEAQIFRKVDNELIAHTPKFELTLKASLPPSEKVIEEVPPNFKTAYDEIVSTTKDIQTRLELGEFNGKDGENGKDGKDGVNGVTPNVSATATVDDNVGVPSVEVTKSGDKENPSFTFSFKNVKGKNGENGINGKDGKDGEPGKGVPAGGKKGQVLKKNSDADYDCVWEDETGVSSDNKLIGTVAKSENPSLSDSFESDIKSLIFHGKSTQVQTTGAQLWNTDGMIYGSFNSSGEIVPNPNGNNAVLKINAIQSGVCGIKCETDSEQGIYITRIYNSSGYSQPYLRLTQGNSDTTSLKLEVGENLILVSGYTGSSVTKFTGNEKIMLVYGTTIPQYEIYTGGKPSPSVEFPQEITKVSELNGNITGKNLFDLDELLKLVPESGDASTVITYNIENLIPKQQYVLSSDIQGSETGTNERCLYLNGTALNNAVYKGHPAIFTASQNEGSCYILYCPFRAFSEQIKSAKTQLEKSLSPTDYVAFDSQKFSFSPPQPLYSTLDGSIEDVVDVEKGQYIYNLGIKIIDENSNPASYGNGSSSLGYGFYVNLKEMKSGNALDGICNIAFVGAINPFPDKPTVTLGQGNTYAYFTKIFDSQKTVQEIKEWLKLNPITIIYPLAEPKIEAIPDETLQQLKNLKTYTEITNFVCNAPVSFQYEQSLQIVIKNILNAINQTKANILLTGGN